MDFMQVCPGQQCIHGIKSDRFISDAIVQSADCSWCYQDDLYRPNYYQSLMEFREQTLQRLQKFVDQRFFKTMDYLTGQLLHLCLSCLGL